MGNCLCHDKKHRYSRYPEVIHRECVLKVASALYNEVESFTCAEKFGMVLTIVVGSVDGTANVRRTLSNISLSGTSKELCL